MAHHDRPTLQEVNAFFLKLGTRAPSTTKPHAILTDGDLVLTAKHVKDDDAWRVFLQRNNMAFVKTELDSRVLSFKVYKEEGGEVGWGLWKNCWDEATEEAKEVYFPLFQLLL
jgi:hypothetical protein